MAAGSRPAATFGATPPLRRIKSEAARARGRRAGTKGSNCEAELLRQEVCDCLGLLTRTGPNMPHALHCGAGAPALLQAPRNPS